MINKTLTFRGIVLSVLFFCIFSVHYLESQTLSNIISFKSGDAAVQKLVFANERLVILQSDEKTPNSKRNKPSALHIFNPATGKDEKTYSVSETGNFMCVADDGNIVAFDEGKKILTMNTFTGEKMSSIEILDNRITHALSFFKQNRGLFLESDTLIITCGVSASKGRFIRNLVSDGLRHYMSPDGTSMVSFSGDSLEVVNMLTGTEEMQMALNKSNKKKSVSASVVFSKDPRFFAVLSRQTINIIDKKNKDVVKSFEVSNADDKIFSFSQDGQFLLGGNDTLKMWSLRTQKEIITPIVCDEKITQTASSNDDKTVAVGGNNGTVKLWYASDESRPDLYYKTEIENDMRGACVKKEFEKTDDFLKRKQKTLNVLRNKYFNMYSESVVNEKTIFQNVYEDDKRTVSNNKKIFDLSLKTINLQIDSISAYDADKETFNIHLKGGDNLVDRWQEIKIPMDENAPCFKQNFKKSIVYGVQQTSASSKRLEVFNVKIKTNCSGEDKTYTSGEQRGTQKEEKEKDKDDELLK